MILKNPCYVPTCPITSEFLTSRASFNHKIHSWRASINSPPCSPNSLDKGPRAHNQWVLFRFHSFMPHHHLITNKQHPSHRNLPKVEKIETLTQKLLNFECWEIQNCSFYILIREGPREKWVERERGVCWVPKRVKGGGGR